MEERPQTPVASLAAIVSASPQGRDGDAVRRWSCPPARPRQISGNWGHIPQSGSPPHKERSPLWTAPGERPAPPLGPGLRRDDEEGRALTRRCDSAHPFDGLRVSGGEVPACAGTTAASPLLHASPQPAPRGAAVPRLPVAVTAASLCGKGRFASLCGKGERVVRARRRGAYAIICEARKVADHCFVLSSAGALGEGCRSDAQ